MIQLRSATRVFGVRVGKPAIEEQDQRVNVRAAVGQRHVREFGGDQQVGVLARDRGAAGVLGIAVLDKCPLDLVPRN
jgi:hypothetical protein